MSSLYLLLLLLLHIIICCNGQAPVFIGHPVSINTTEGSVVEFTCIANNNPTLVIYLVNGSGGGVDPNKGFNEQAAVTIDSNTISRVLLVTTSVADNDNSMIKCQAINADLMGANSDTAILRVQGPLSSVVDLSYSFVDSLTVNISWSPPFTLPGTDITGYNISATSNGTTTNYFTSNRYYELSLTDITDSPCNEIIITVSGYNGLDGENTTLTGIYLSTVPVSSITIPVSIIISNDLSLSMIVDLTNISIGNHPSVIEVSLYINDILVDNIINNNITVTNESTVTVTNITTLVVNQRYTTVVSFSNLAGQFDKSTIATFDTYDLVSVRVLNSSDSRVCLECSFSSFSTDNAGCTVELVSPTNSTLTYTQSFPRSSDDSSIAIGCIYGINTGQYSITVHDTTNTVIAVTTSIIELFPVVPVITPTTSEYTCYNTLGTSVSSSSVMITQPAQSDGSYGSVFVIGFFPGIITGVIIEGIIVAMIVLVYCRVKGMSTVKSSPLTTATDSNNDIIPTSNPAYELVTRIQQHERTIPL